MNAGTVAEGEIVLMRSRLANRCGRRMSTMISSKSQSAARSASHARIAQLDALRVPE
jgi:hypothetical protein